MRGILFLISIGLLIVGGIALEDASTSAIPLAHIGEQAVTHSQAGLAAIGVGACGILLVGLSYRHLIQGDGGDWYVRELVVGGALTLLLLAFVNRNPAFDSSCYALGSFRPRSLCIETWIYYAAWVAAIVPLAAGLVGLLRSARLDSAVRQLQEAVSRRDALAPRSVTLTMVSVPHIVAGLALAFILLAFVNKFEFLGNTCYYFGSFSLQSTCIPPWIYFAAWFAVMGLVLYGFRGTLLPKAAPPDQPHERKPDSDIR